MTRPLTRREWLGNAAPFAAAAALAPTLASCDRSRPRQYRSDSTVTVLYAGDAQSIFAPGDSAQAQFLVFVPLASWNQRGELEGRLAKSWSASSDFRTWTIGLRDGVRWHDGVPVTAHDMKFTLDLLTQPEAQTFAPDSYNVAVLDDLTYRITFQRQELIASGAIDDSIPCWPKHLLEDLDPKQINSWDFWNQPVGCGPYRHVRALPQTMMEFEANPDYFRGRPKIERVVLKFSNSGSSIPELLSGNVDATASWNRRDIASAIRNRWFRVYQRPGTGCAAIWWNTRHHLFQDASVRRALTLAINRRELMELYDIPAETPIVDFLFTRRQLERDDFANPIPHDRRLANRLLDEAGWSMPKDSRLRQRDGSPFRFTVLVPGREEGDDMAIYVQDQLKHVGVHMEIRQSETIWDRIKSGEFEAANIFFDGWVDLEQSLHGAGYDDASFFELLEKTRSTFDPTDKDRLYRELTTLFQSGVPVTLLFPSTSYTIATTRIRGLDGSPYRGDLTRCMDELWLEGQL